MSDKKDFLSGFCLFVFGLFLAYQSMRLTIWGKFGPQEGFFPLILAIIIIGLSLLIIIKSLVSTQLKKKEKMFEEQQRNEVSIFRVSSYAILMLLYMILIESGGFFITTSLFLILILKFVERQGWKVSLLVILASNIISYLLFVYFLGVPLPKGFIKW